MNNFAQKYQQILNETPQHVGLSQGKIIKSKTFNLGISIDYAGTWDGDDNYQLTIIPPKKDNEYMYSIGAQNDRSATIKKLEVKVKKALAAFDKEMDR